MAAKNMPVPAKKPSRGKAYESIIERLFREGYKPRARTVDFSREQILTTAKALGVDPKNVGDLVYTYRYRRRLPESITSRAPKGHVWLIRGKGAAKYRFVAVKEDQAYINPQLHLAETRIPDATPGVIAMYALDDEQALLAKVRYNRLIDIFLGVATYSLQSHLRTQVAEIGQVETDEVYVGIDKQGAHFVFPVQAKGGKDRHSMVQIEQDFAMCAERFPNSICRAIAAQFIDGEKIALFALKLDHNGDPRIVAEKHYVLVPPFEISAAELEEYRNLSTVE